MARLANLTNASTNKNWLLERSLRAFFEHDLVTASKLVTPDFCLEIVNDKIYQGPERSATALWKLAGLGADIQIHEIFVDISSATVTSVTKNFLGRYEAYTSRIDFSDDGERISNWELKISPATEGIWRPDSELVDIE